MKVLRKKFDLPKTDEEKDKEKQKERINLVGSSDQTKLTDINERLEAMDRENEVIKSSDPVPPPPEEPLKPEPEEEESKKKRVRLPKFERESEEEEESTGPSPSIIPNLQFRVLENESPKLFNVPEGIGDFYGLPQGQGVKLLSGEVEQGMFKIWSMLKEYAWAAIEPGSSQMIKGLIDYAFEGRKRTHEFVFAPGKVRQKSDDDTWPQILANNDIYGIGLVNDRLFAAGLHSSSGVPVLLYDIEDGSWSSYSGSLDTGDANCTVQGRCILDNKVYVSSEINIYEPSGSSWNKVMADLDFDTYNILDITTDGTNFYAVVTDNSGDGTGLGQTYLWKITAGGSHSVLATISSRDGGVKLGQVGYESNRSRIYWSFADHGGISTEIYSCGVDGGNSQIASISGRKDTGYVVSSPSHGYIAIADEIFRLGEDDEMTKIYEPVGEGVSDTGVLDIYGSQIGIGFPMDFLNVDWDWASTERVVRRPQDSKFV